jgi:hypothetical protein
LYEMLNLNDMRNSLFYDVGNCNPLTICNSYQLMINLITKGCFLSRDLLTRFLDGNEPKLQRFKQYFSESRYNEWLDTRLDNVFITAQSCDVNTTIVFTGNPTRYKMSSKYIQFIKLSHANLTHAISCSSSIPLFFETLKADGKQYCVDGATYAWNNSNILQTLHNMSYYTTCDCLYKDIFDWLEPVKKEFVIHIDKINFQQRFEKLVEYRQNKNELINTIDVIKQFVPRTIVTARDNSAMLSIYQNQPFLKEYSTSDVNDIKYKVYDSYCEELNAHVNKQKVFGITRIIGNIPSEYVSKKDFKNNCCYQTKSYTRYMKQYNKYKEITNRQPVSSYIYDFRSYDVVNIKIRVLSCDTFVRNLYDCPVSIYLDILVYKNADDIINTNKGAGVIQGNVLYNLLLKKNKQTVNNAVTMVNNSYDDFLGLHH